VDAASPQMKQAEKDQNVDCLQIISEIRRCKQNEYYQW